MLILLAAFFITAGPLSTIQLPRIDALPGLGSQVLPSLQVPEIPAAPQLGVQLDAAAPQASLLLTFPFE